MRAKKPAIFFLCLIAFFSCKKEGNIGLDIQPQDDLFNAATSDTVTVVTQTYIQDSVRTDETTLGISGLYTQMIGSYVDPVFGKTSASLYAQLSLPGNVTNVNLGSPTDLVLDSIVLTLPFSGKAYGTKEQQTFKIYQLDESLYLDSAYYSTTKKKYSTLLGSKNFIPNPDSTVQIGSTKLKAHLRIKLDSLFGVSLLGKSGSTELSSNSNFQTFFKGLHITSDNPLQAAGEGAILNFLMNDPLSAVTLYYRNTGTSPDTAEFSFQINTTSAYFNNFYHNYQTSPDIFGQINNSVFVQNNLVYIQSMQGLKTRITFPYLKNLKTLANNSINRAELILTADPATTGTYSPPSRLFVVPIDSTGKPDSYTYIDLRESETYYGGTYNSTTREFRFNITRQIQALLTGGKADYGMNILSKVSDNYTANLLFLPLASGSSSPERVVLGGGGNSSGIKMKLKLTYTRFN